MLFVKANVVMIRVDSFIPYITEPFYHSSKFSLLTSANIININIIPKDMLLMGTCPILVNVKMPTIL